MKLQNTGTVGAAIYLKPEELKILYRALIRTAFPAKIAVIENIDVAMPETATELEKKAREVFVLIRSIEACQKVHGLDDKAGNPKEPLMHVQV